MPQRVSAVLAAKGGPTQYWAGGYNVMPDQCTYIIADQMRYKDYVCVEHVTDDELSRMLIHRELREVTF